MRISDWSSDVCSSDLCQWLRCPQSSDVRPGCNCYFIAYLPSILTRCCAPLSLSVIIFRHFPHVASSRNIVAHDHEQVVIILRPTILLLLTLRSEEHTSELQSLMRSSYAVFCLLIKLHTQKLKV